MNHPTKAAALTHFLALYYAAQPTSVQVHSAAEAIAELFARVRGERCEIRIGKTIIARGEK
jgi:hypothetical protein